VEEGSWLVLCISSSKGPLYIVGRGCTLPLHQGSPRAAARSGARPALPETLTLAGLGQGLGAPFFFLSSLMGFFR
jgi:hypothetical protein